MSNGPLAFLRLFLILRYTTYNYLYLNSFFSFRYSIFPLLLRRFFLLPPSKVVLAPRGELSSAALGLKSFKKSLFLTISRILRLHCNITWQASSQFEATDIFKTFHSPYVHIAPDLPPCSFEATLESLPKKPAGSPTKFVFLSRVSRIKNLHLLLIYLQDCKNTLSLDIYGPIEDQAYWLECLLLIQKLPQHVHVKYVGFVHPSCVQPKLSSYHFFLLPSGGENFCFAILESLLAGTPVLISDMTPWRSRSDKCIQTCPPHDADGWLSLLDWACSTTEATLRELSINAHAYATSYVNSNASLDRTISLFS